MCYRGIGFSLQESAESSENFVKKSIANRLLKDQELTLRCLNMDLLVFFVFFVFYLPNFLL